MAGSNTSDISILYKFFIITTIIWASVYLVITFFGNEISDIPTNGNVIVPLATDALSWVISAVNTVTFGVFSGGLTLVYDQIIIFMSVWNIVNIYLFYIIFIPYILVTIFILVSLF